MRKLSIIFCIILISMVQLSLFAQYSEVDKADFNWFAHIEGLTEGIDDPSIWVSWGVGFEMGFSSPFSLGFYIGFTDWGSNNERFAYTSNDDHQIYYSNEIIELELNIRYYFYPSMRRFFIGSNIGLLIFDSAEYPLWMVLGANLGYKFVFGDIHGLSVEPLIGFNYIGLLRDEPFPSLRFGVSVGFQY